MNTTETLEDPRPTRRRHRRAARIAFGTFAALVIATQAFAQGGTARRAYVDLGVSADADWNTYAPDVDTVAAFVVGAGVKSPRGWTVRAEGSVPAWHDAPTYEQYVRTMSNSSVPLLVTERGSGRHQIATVAGLVGREFSLGRRVTLTPLGGLGVAFHRDRESGIQEIQGPSGTTSSSTECACDNQSLASLQWGADAAIALTPRLSLVPQVRFHAVVSHETYGYMVRPAVTARLRF